MEILTKRYLSYKQEKYLGDRKILEHRKSYVRLIDMPDMYYFYHKLNILLKTHISAQLPHITLFTKGKILVENILEYQYLQKQHLKNFILRKLKYSDTFSARAEFVSLGV